ncbi:MAG: diphosphomevalonate decarboxylase [Candidatus Bathyarchaeia archaeon]
MKATAVAHPIQGLVKYHGLKDPKLRIPFHDSISVCVKALCTVTTIETDKTLRHDSVVVNGRKLVRGDLERVKMVLDGLREAAGYAGYFRVESENSIREGKGLGFSASGFAALGTAACEALGLDLDPISLSEIVRLGAGSATRSLAGAFAIWYANRRRRSYAEQLAGPGAVDLAMVIVPISSTVKTDEAHAEVLSSPLFSVRLKRVGKTVETMKRAIQGGNISTIGRLAEEDSLDLHAITMTGKSHMVLWEPETIRIIREVVKMRKGGTPAWYSIDTGPSVFINTPRSHAEEVASRLRKAGFKKVICSSVGDKPSIIDEHLF